MSIINNKETITMGQLVQNEMFELRSENANLSKYNLALLEEVKTLREKVARTNQLGQYPSSSSEGEDEVWCDFGEHHVFMSEMEKGNGSCMECVEGERINNEQNEKIAKDRLKFKVEDDDVFCEFGEHYVHMDEVDRDHESCMDCRENNELEWCVFKGHYVALKEMKINHESCMTCEESMVWCRVGKHFTTKQKHISSKYSWSEDCIMCVGGEDCVEEYIRCLIE